MLHACILSNLSYYSDGQVIYYHGSEFRIMPGNQKNGVVLKIMYRKRQKLSERKSLRFTEFYPNLGKTFVIFALSVLKVLPLLKGSVRKTFAIHKKSSKPVKLSLA